MLTDIESAQYIISHVTEGLKMADKYNLDIKQIVLDKLRRNAEKYPVEKAYGSAKKYNEL